MLSFRSSQFVDDFVTVVDVSLLYICGRFMGWKALFSKTWSCSFLSSSEYSIPCLNHFSVKHHQCFNKLPQATGHAAVIALSLLYGTNSYTIEQKCQPGFG
jgi:hypothetical protein